MDPDDADSALELKLEEQLLGQHGQPHPPSEDAAGDAAAPVAADDGAAGGELEEADGWGEEEQLQFDGVGPDSGEPSDGEQIGAAPNVSVRSLMQLHEQLDASQRRCYLADTLPGALVAILSLVEGAEVRPLPEQPRYQRPADVPYVHPHDFRSARMPRTLALAESLCRFLESHAGASCFISHGEDDALLTVVMTCALVTDLSSKPVRCLAQHGAT